MILIYMSDPFLGYKRQKKNQQAETLTMPGVLYRAHGWRLIDPITTSMQSIF